MSKSKHLDYLTNHCRVCGKIFGKRTQYNCRKYSIILMILGVDPSDDSEDVRSTSFCNGCYLKAKRASSNSTQKYHGPEWLPHSDSFCIVCDEKSKGERPKKLTSNGRPSLLRTHILSIACRLPRFTLQQVVDISYNENITCNKCNSAVNDPVEVLPCKTLVCASCILAHLNKDILTFNCPGCLEEHNNDTSSFSQLSPVVEKMLLNMIVKCDKCYQKVKLSNINESCACHKDHESLNTLTAVATQPLEASPTQLEKQVTTNVLSRLFHQSNSSIITLLSKRQESTILVSRPLLLLFPL